MKRSLLFAALLVVSVILNAQSPEKTIAYFDNDWQPTKKKNKAAYYRESFFERDTLFVVDYYITGIKQMTGQFSARKGEIKVGLFSYYDEKGNKSSEGHYKNNKADGEWIFLFSTGQISEKGLFADDNREGEWISYRKDKTIEQICLYKNGKIIKVKSLNSDGSELTAKDTFDLVDQMPEFPGGQEAMMRFLSSKLNYPAKARENNIQGRVILQFVINKEGFLSDTEVLKSVNEDLENEAIRVVEMMPNWIPGKQDGVPVAVRFTLPIVFKLN